MRAPWFAADSCLLLYLDMGEQKRERQRRGRMIEREKEGGIISIPLFIFERFYLFILRDWKAGRKRGKETLSLMHPLLGTWPITQASALTGN